MIIARKMKNSLLIVCLILLVCLVIPLKGIYAAGNATITIETIEAETDEEVKLAVTLSSGTLPITKTLTTSQKDSWPSGSTTRQ